MSLDRLRHIQDNAACSGMDVDLFYAAESPKGTRSNYKALSKIRRVCESCPVKSECLAFAIDTYEYGVWGGTTENERALIRRQRKGAA